jgi:hypothetical protein
MDAVSAARGNRFVRSYKARRAIDLTKIVKNAALPKAAR